MSSITFTDFKKLDLRIATIKSVEEVEGADKLLKLTLDVGDLGERVVAAGIKQWYTPEYLIGKQIVYLANLEQKELKGVVSQGMLVAAGGDEAILIHPDKETTPGTPLR